MKKDFTTSPVPSRKRRNWQVANVSWKQFYSKAKTLKHTYTSEVFACFYFSQTELGQPNAEFCDRPNTCNFC